MQRFYHDKKNNFAEIFDVGTGLYVRSGILERGKSTEKDPFSRNAPGLIDIGIMNRCRNRERGVCTVDCYQGGNSSTGPNMTLGNYKKIIDECRSFVFQVALGGLGDPNQHEDFEKIMRYTRENDIVPNYTTSGFELTEKEVEITKYYAGAVAVSYYSPKQTENAIRMFQSKGVKTNIHFVLSKKTIQQAIRLLTTDGFHRRVNAMIFLLHKPVGLGRKEDCLETDSESLKTFFSIINNWRGEFKIGFDSCSIPGLLNYANKIARESIDACEGGRFSMYVTSDMVAVPCSFDQERRYGVGLYEKGFSIIEAWNSLQFAEFRHKLRSSCPECGERENCYGGCPLVKEITLCERKERKAI